MVNVRQSYIISPFSWLSRRRLLMELRLRSHKQMPSWQWIGGVHKRNIDFSGFEDKIEQYFEDRWQKKLALLFNKRPSLFFRDFAHRFSIPKWSGNKWRASEIAISLSHIQAWERAVKHYSWVLILEDDVILDPKMDYKALEIPHNNADLISLAKHGIIYKKTYTPTHALISHEFPKKNPNWSACAYYLSPKGAQRLLKESQPVRDEIDVHMFLSAHSNTMYIYLNQDTKQGNTFSTRKGLVNELKRIIHKLSKLSFHSR